MTLTSFYRSSGPLIIGKGFKPLRLTVYEKNFLLKIVDFHAELSPLRSRRIILVKIKWLTVLSSGTISTLRLSSNYYGSGVDLITMFLASGRITL